MNCSAAGKEHLFIDDDKTCRDCGEPMPSDAPDWWKRGPFTQADVDRARARVSAPSPPVATTAPEDSGAREAEIRRDYTSGSYDLWPPGDVAFLLGLIDVERAALAASEGFTRFWEREANAWAADRDRLAAEVERLRGALKTVRDYSCDGDASTTAAEALSTLHGIARDLPIDGQVHTRVLRETMLRLTAPPATPKDGGGECGIEFQAFAHRFKCTRPVGHDGTCATDAKNGTPLPSTSSPASDRGGDKP